jgi:hypothetical protein
MAKEKKILITIPGEFNYKLNLYLLKIRDVGAKITKAELILRLADLGLKVEKKEIEFSEKL